MSAAAHTNYDLTVSAYTACLDDFLPDPDATRTRALQAAYAPLGTGLAASGLYTDYLPEEGVIARISDFLERPLVPADPRGTGRFSLRTAQMTMGMDVHADDCDWGAILYLNRPEHCEGGTSIFRHRASGHFHLPLPEQQKELGLGSTAEAWDYFVRGEGLDRSRWEEIYRAEMAYNRLVLIPGGLFHSHSSTFGSDLSDGRLVQLYFLNDAS
jgi:hypothetical protein